MARLAMRILLLGTFLDKAYALNPSFISGKAFSDLIDQPAVDFVDDLQMTRQHLLKPCDAAISQELRAAGCDWCMPKSFA